MHRFIASRRSRKGPGRQKGAEIVEFLITLPVILIVLAIMFDFGSLFSDQILLSNAARVAAREVINGATDNEAQLVANKVTQSLLNADSSALPVISVTRAGADPGDQVTVTITHPFTFLLLPGWASSAATFNLTATVTMSMLPT